MTCSFIWQAHPFENLMFDWFKLAFHYFRNRYLLDINNYGRRPEQPPTQECSGDPPGPCWHAGWFVMTCSFIWQANPLENLVYHYFPNRFLLDINNYSRRPEQPPTQERSGGSLGPCWHAGWFVMTCSFIWQANPLKLMAIFIILNGWSFRW